MNRHVFPQRAPHRATLLALAVLILGSTVRAQEEPPKPAPVAPADAATDAAEPEEPGPPVVGEAFPTHLPMTPMPPEGAAPEKPAVEPSAEGAKEGQGPARESTGEAKDDGGAESETTSDPEEKGVALATIVGDEPRPLVLLLWSTRCVVCERYTKSVAALALKLGDRAAVAVVVSGGEESAETARRAFDDLGSSVRVFLDTEMLAAGALGVRVTPTAFVVGTDNVLRYRGPVDDDRRARPRDARALLLPAVEAVIAGREVETGDVPPFGSAIR